MKSQFADKYMKHFKYCVYESVNKEAFVQRKKPPKQN